MTFQQFTSVITLLQVGEKEKTRLKISTFVTETWSLYRRKNIRLVMLNSDEKDIMTQQIENNYIKDSFMIRVVHHVL
jgi:hypothetical protein